MSLARFTVTEHTSPCSFIRQYPHSVKREDAELRLAVKEYRPKNYDPSSSENAVTIIAAHGNGFPKECFEPLWDDLLSALPGVQISSIWVADIQHQGASYALNEKELGDDPGFFDHSLDLLLMINKFRNKMTERLIGIAHSMGSNQIAYLASIHPRLFQSVIFIDPIMTPAHPNGPNAAMFSSLRREKWDSRAKAEAQISKNPFYKSMDPRALKTFLAYGLTDTADGGVKLATPKAQEAWTYLRVNFEDISEDTVEGRRKERLLSPETVPFSYESKLRMMRPEVLAMWELLPSLRPRVLFIYGANSHINPPESQKAQGLQTGGGRGGNGGIKDEGVVQKVLENCTHMIVFEKPSEVAKTVSEWIETETVRWKQEKDFWDTIDTGRSKNGRTELSDRWIAAVKEDKETERSKPVKTAKL